MALRCDTIEALETIDAAIFSGDEFRNAAARVELWQYLSRWDKELTSIRDNEVENGTPSDTA
jgi:hypothetical protein